MLTGPPRLLLLAALVAGAAVPLPLPVSAAPVVAEEGAIQIERPPEQYCGVNSAAAGSESTMDAALLHERLAATARALVADGRGILAADESTTTVGKRLASIGVENTEPNRAALRQLLFTADGVERHVSGVILYEETLFQAAPDGGGGGRLVDALTRRGVQLGIKVDTGVVPLPGSGDGDGETYTQGLDGLAARCERYAAAGATFAKWRAVISIREPAAGRAALPSEAAVAEAARGLAMYAAIAQRAGLVPIVEPEVLSDGGHPLAACEAATARVLAAVFKALQDANVLLEGMLLKPNMVTPGSSSSGGRAAPEEVAAATLRVLRRTVPPAVPGIVFLSGGQSEADATRHLALMAAETAGPTPWALSFSYGRALQASALKAWGGSAANVATAQAAFMRRAAANSAAARGQLEAE